MNGEYSYTVCMIRRKIRASRDDKEKPETDLEIRLWFGRLCCYGLTKTRNLVTKIYRLRGSLYSRNGIWDGSMIFVVVDVIAEASVLVAAMTVVVAAAVEVVVAMVVVVDVVAMGFGVAIAVVSDRNVLPAIRTLTVVVVGASVALVHGITGDSGLIAIAVVCS